MMLGLGEGDQVSAIQFDLVYRAPALSVAHIETGEAAVAAGKTVSSYQLDEGKHRLIIIGMNKDPISNGVVAEVYFGVSDQARNGTYPVDLENQVLSNPVGIEVPAETEPGAVTVSGGLDPEGEDNHGCRPGCLGGSTDGSGRGGACRAVLAGLVLVTLAIATRGLWGQVLYLVFWRGRR